MPEADPVNDAFTWSTHFVRALFERGINQVVISPGSRSTALTLAFASHPGFEKKVIIDERSAAFTALGMAKASGKPAVLVCTSGTAAANYFPAVIEARQSGIPLILATADRPPELRGIGASQAIDQLKLFGDYPVFFHEAGLPDISKNSLKRLELAVQQALDFSLRREGPVHINFPFRKPFEPDKKYLKKVRKENEKHANRLFPGYDSEHGKKQLDETFWSDLVSAEKPLIVVGPTTANDITQLIEILSTLLKAPILAEPGSNIPLMNNQIEGFDGFLRKADNLEALGADLILRFGKQPVSKALNQYLAAMDQATQISFIRPSLWEDGSLSSDKQVMLDAPIQVPEITGASDGSWLKAWKDAESRFSEKREKVLANFDLLTDGGIFSELSPLIPEQSFTMLSNSLPVRDLSLFGTFTGREIYVNRGAAGIDGITSTAMGISHSLQSSGVLFIGDIAFLHDTNALLSAGMIENPLVVVVINNGGGTIFRMLPVHSVKDSYEAYFETPQQASIAALCRAHKVEHSLVSKPGQLKKVFRSHLKINGLSVMECMTDADDSMKQRQELWNFSLTDET